MEYFHAKYVHDIRQRSHYCGVPMKKIALVAIIALAVSFSVMAYKFALLLDSGTALDDARSETERQRERSIRALLIIKNDWVGRDAADISHLSGIFHDGSVIVKVREDHIEIGDLIFDVGEGVVRDVRYFD